MGLSLEKVLREVQIERDKAVISLDLLEEILDELFYDPREETQEILADEKMARAIEKFEKGTSRLYSLEEAKKLLEL